VEREEHLTQISKLSGYARNVIGFDEIEAHGDFELSVDLRDRAARDGYESAILPGPKPVMALRNVAGNCDRGSTDLGRKTESLL
jgi:hypothetical protein